MALFELGNTLGLYGLAAIGFLILLYLIRPKPRTIKIPSLMFLLQQRGENKFKSFFKNLLKDLLLLIQLLGLLFLILPLTEPYIFMDRDISSKNTIIVLDTSASMQTNQGDSTRYKQALKIAKDNIHDRNSIILAKNIPVVGIEDASKHDTLNYLNNIKVTETASRIGAAMLTAGELLNQQEGRIIVVSDFINTEGILPETAKVAIESKGMIVDLINIASPITKSNVGIIDLNVDQDSSTIYIKNFNKNQKTITLLISGTEKSITIAGNSIETYSFKTPSGLNNIEIKEIDDLLADNKVILNNPLKPEVSVLLITNDKSFYMETLLNSLPKVQLTVNEPPIVSKEKFDIYITHNVLPEELLPGTIENINTHVKSGSNLIVHAQGLLDKIDFDDMLPIIVSGVGGEAFIEVDQTNGLTNNMDFGKVSAYITGTSKESTITMASVEENPMLAFKPHGDGKVFYYGISELDSDFKLTPYYPVFWNNLFKFLIEKDNIKSLNLKTGETLIRNDEVTIKTPYTSITSNSLLLDHAGLYSIDNVDVAVNFLNEKESSINPSDLKSVAPDSLSLEPVNQNQKINIELILILIASAFIIMELFYIKLRGDI